MTVDAAKTDRLATLVFEQVDKILVDLARKHHLDDIDRFLIGHTQTVHKFRLLADLTEHFGDLGSAAVHKHDLDTDERQKNDVSHHGFLEVVVDHCVSAVLHNDDLIVIFFDIGQRFNEHLCALCIGNIHLLFHRNLLRCDSRR